MKLPIAIIIACLALASITPGAELGKPTWAKPSKATPGNMADITITVPVTKVGSREAVSCTVHLIGTDGREIAHADLSDILSGDGVLRQTIQVSKADASQISKVTIDR